MSQLQSMPPPFPLLYISFRIKIIVLGKHLSGQKNVPRWLGIWLELGGKYKAKKNKKKEKKKIRNKNRQKQTTKAKTNK